MDVSKLQPGDIIHIRGVVQAVSGDNIRVAPYNNSSRRYVKAEDVLSVEPRPLKAGDRVRIGSSTPLVLHIHEAYAWVEGFGVCISKKLERV